MEDVNVRLLFCDFFLTVFIMVIMLMIQNNEMLNESVISFVGAGMIGKVKNLERAHGSRSLFIHMFFECKS